MVTSVSRLVRALLSPIPLLTLVVVSGAAAVAFVLLGHAAAEQERRLLTERADEAAIIVDNGISTVDASLSSLAAIGDASGTDVTALFDRLAGPRIAGRTTALALASPTPDGYAVTNVAGRIQGPSGALDPALQAVLSRAATLDEPALVTAVVGAGVDRRTVFARTAGGDTVAFQESVASDRAADVGLGAGFTDLRAALYASADAALDTVVLTTDDQLPVSGLAGVTTRPISVGADTWQLAVGARTALIGPLTAALPWVALAGGLVAGLLAAIIAAGLLRRREYAERIADERTRSLAVTLDELAGTRAFLTDVLTYGPTVVVVTTMSDRRITYVSPNLRRELGIDPAALTRELPLAQRVHPDDLADAYAMLQAVSDGAFSSGSAEYRIADDTGEYRWVSATIIPLDSNPDGQDLPGESLVLTYLVDIDKRRRAEEELRAATQAAEAANRSKSQFLSRMSHELRTPLNAIIGFGQVLELEDLTDVQRDSVEHVLKGGRHLLTLINEVLDISRVEAGELNLSPEAVLAADVLNDAVGMIGPLARERRITIHVDTAACSCHVFADRQRVKQVLLNLLSNAIKYNRAQGSILVRCTQSPTHLQIDVQDTGIGIAAERLDLLFTPFERLGAEQTGEEGTGIGLALSKKLTEAMGGSLTASSAALGQGSTFSLTLPLVEGPVDRVERLGALAVAETSALDQRAVVLHVEDNASNVTLVERILSARPHVQVVTAMQGTLGVELARQHRPALVLLDLHLPDLDGEEVLRRLRDDPMTSTVPVVIVSADATHGQVQRILSAGAAAYLTKPIDVRDLLRVVDDAVMAGSGPEERS